MQIGQYFLAHAINAYGGVGISTDFKAAAMTIDKIKAKNMTEVTRRDVVRMCKWVSSTQDAQDVISCLEDYGYIKLSSIDSSDRLRNGRPKNAVYTVNPMVA